MSSLTAPKASAGLMWECSVVVSLSGRLEGDQAAVPQSPGWSPPEVGRGRTRFQTKLNYVRARPKWVRATNHVWRLAIIRVIT